MDCDPARRMGLHHLNVVRKSIVAQSIFGCKTSQRTAAGWTMHAEVHILDLRFLQKLGQMQQPWDGKLTATSSAFEASLDLCNPVSPWPHPFPKLVSGRNQERP